MRLVETKNREREGSEKTEPWDPPTFASRDPPKKTEVGEDVQL